VDKLKLANPTLHQMPDSHIAPASKAEALVSLTLGIHNHA